MLEIETLKEIISTVMGEKLESVDIMEDLVSSLLKK